VEGRAPSRPQRNPSVSCTDENKGFEPQRVWKCGEDRLFRLTGTRGPGVLQHGNRFGHFPWFETPWSVYGNRPLQALVGAAMPCKGLD